MKKRLVFLIAASAVIFSTTAIKPAIAYFTDTEMAEARVPVFIDDGKPELDEKVVDMTKYISISNTGDYDIFVRVKAIYSDTSCTVTMEPSEDWSFNDDGYYYYSDPVAPGDKTATELKLKIANKTDLPFNVIIANEAVKAIYNSDGTAKPVDWSTGKVTSQSNVEVPPVEEEPIMPVSPTEAAEQW